MWECPTCRTQGMDREARVCTLAQDRYPIREPIVARLSRDEILSLAREDKLRIDLIGKFDHPPTIVCGNRRTICPVGLVGSEELTYLAMEADAREYGTGEPVAAHTASVFRLIRAERADAQSRRLKKHQEQQPR